MTGNSTVEHFLALADGDARFALVLACAMIETLAPSVSNGFLRAKPRDPVRPAKSTAPAILSGDEIQ